MKTSQIQVQNLIGKRVRDQRGKSIGRLQEIHAQYDGKELVVKEYLLGPAGLLERLAVTGLHLRLVPFIKLDKYFSSQRIPWNKLDISDPNHPRLL